VPSPFKTVAALLAVGAAAVAAANDVAAHPHVLVDAKAEIVFDDHQRIAAVRNVWQFDAAFSAFAVQGLDADGDGKFSAAELAPLAQENVEALAEYDYFTYLVAGERAHAFKPPTDYRDEFDGDRLTLTFTLPLEEPVAVDDTVKIEIFDPEYFVAITLVDGDGVSLDGAPPSCTAAYEPPHELDASTMMALAAIPIGEHDLPPDLLDAASALANRIEVSCAGGTSAEPAVTRPAGAATSRPAAADRTDVPAPAAVQSPTAGDARTASGVTKTPLGRAVSIGLLVALVAALAACTVLLVRRLRVPR